MTEKERKERLARAQAQQDAIRRARETAQLTRLLWPQDAEDDLHGKVEILTQRLRAAGQTGAAWQVATNAHTSAWRKVKHTRHISDPGDVTHAWWYESAQTARLDAEAAVCAALQAHRIARSAEECGASDAVCSLVSAAYWVAVEVADRAEFSQEQLPCFDNDDVLSLHRTVGEWIGCLQAAKDDLVAWAKANDYTITR